MNFLKNYFLGKKFRQLQQQHQKLLGNEQATASLANSCIEFTRALAGRIEAKGPARELGVLSETMFAEITARLDIWKNAPVRFRNLLVNRLHETNAFRVIMRVDMADWQKVSLRAENGVICEMGLNHSGQALVTGLKLWSAEMVFSAQQNPDHEMLTRLTQAFWQDQLYKANHKSSKKAAQKVCDVELLTVKAMKPNTDTETAGYTEYQYLFHNGLEIQEKKFKQIL